MSFLDRFRCCKCCQEEEVDWDEILRLRRRAQRMAQRRKYDPRLRRKELPEDIKRVNGLNLACREGELEVVKQFVETQNVGVNARDRERAWNGWTPVMNAAVHDQHKVVKYMLSKGADPDATTKHGETALMFAAGAGHVKSVKLLLGKQYGDAKVNMRTMTGVSALNKAAFSGHLKVVKLLVEMGEADVSEAGYDDTHTTPLMEACVAGELKVVKYLCAKGADLGIVRKGRTAEDYASERGHDSIVSLLRKVRRQRGVQAEKDARRAAKEERKRRLEEARTAPMPRSTLRVQTQRLPDKSNHARSMRLRPGSSNGPGKKPKRGSRRVGPAGDAMSSRTLKGPLSGHQLQQLGSDAELRRVRAGLAANAAGSGALPEEGSRRTLGLASAVGIGSARGSKYRLQQEHGDGEMPGGSRGHLSSRASRRSMARGGDGDGAAGGSPAPQDRGDDSDHGGTATGSRRA